MKLTHEQVNDHFAEEDHRRNERPDEWRKSFPS